MKKRRCCDETRTQLVSNHRMSKLKTHTIAWNISRNNLYSCGLCTRMLTVYWVIYVYSTYTGLPIPGHCLDVDCK